jgi:polysaccharide export outer membrane protein
MAAMKIPAWLIATLLACVAYACAAQQDYVWFSEVPSAETSAVIAPGDKIAVTVDQHAELSGEFEIGAAGTYNQPLAGAIGVGGMAPSAAATQIANKLSRYIKAPSVKVTLLSRPPLTVPVVGEVRSPGTYTVPAGSNVLTAVAFAGGLSDFADEDHIFVLRSKPTPLRIRFRYSDLLTPSVGASRFALQDGDAVLVE